MRKMFTLWAMLLTVALCSQAVLTLPRPVNIKSDLLPEKASVEVGQRLMIGEPIQNAPSTNLEDDDASIYAYRLYASSGTLHGWYNFTAKYPDNFEMVKSFGNAAGDYGICAATNAKGTTYAYIFQHYGSDGTGWNDIQMPIGIGILDHTTGEYEVKYNTESFHTFQYNQLFYDMAYDPVTDVIYACEFAYGSNGEFTGMMNIYAINPETCVPTLLGQADNVFTAMAADNGFVYGLTQIYDEDAQKAVTRVVKFDPTKIENGVFKTETVKDIVGGENIAYSVQSMEFDLTTHKLYWFGYRVYSETDIKGFVAEINLKNGKLVNEAIIPYSAQYLGMTIPYQRVADSAPAAVTSYSLSRPDSSAKEVTLTWKNPTKSYNLESLTELTGVKIYRDGELIHTEATTTPGAEVTWVDTTLENGVHVYKLVPYNSAGDGISKDREIYGGEDVPGFVHNILATTDQDKLTLTWEAPTAGKHQCWFDSANVTYDVYRGSYAIAKGITETTISDQVNEFAAYTYRIVPCTSAGEGVSTEIIVTYGPPVELPYENDFSESEMVDEVTVVDYNKDGLTWTYSSGWGAYEYVAASAYGFESDANDYLIFPTFEVTAGKKYEFQFEYYTSNYYDTYEDVEIVVGTTSAIEDLTNVVSTMKIEAGENGMKWIPARAQYLATEDGFATFAIHIISKTDSGFLIVKNILIREMADTEVSALSITGPAEVFTNTEYTYNVKVVNEGTTEVKGAKALIVDENGNEIASTNVPDIKVGETADVAIAWVPTSEMELKVYGSVELDGEEYTDDNTTAEYIQVKVNAEGSDPWLSIGEIDMDNYDNRVIAINNKYSRCQTIYFDSEIRSQFDDLDQHLQATGKDYIEITGMRLFYGASKAPELLTALPLVIRMENTEIDGLIDPWYYGPLSNPSNSNYDETSDGILDYIYQTEGLTTVFDGTIDLSGESTMNTMEIKFEEPFMYKPGMNLRLDLDRADTETYDYVYWYLDYNDDISGRASKWSFDGSPILLGRCGFYNATVPYNPEDDPSDFWGNNWHTAMDWFPCIKFSYSNKSSVDAVDSVANLYVLVNEGTLNFNQTCESVEIFNLAGFKVANSNYVNSLTTDLPAGIYIVKAVAGGNTITKKVMIK